MLYALENISYVYPESVSGGKSLDRVSLEIDSGEFIALIGEIGSGKSTLLKLLVGLLKPTEGTILFNGAPIPVRGKALRELRRRAGMVFQFAEAQVFESSALKEAAYGLMNYDYPQGDIPGLAREALKMTGLPPEKFGEKSPFELSGGERKRLALASILALKPDMLLLDEPAAGLDSDGRRMLKSVLSAHREAGKGAILVSHDLDLSMELCGRVIILHRGGKVYDGGRDIFYEVEKLKGWGLEEPELVQAWKDIMGKGPASAEKIFSVEDADRLLRGFNDE